MGEAPGPLLPVSQEQSETKPYIVDIWEGASLLGNPLPGPLSDPYNSTFAQSQHLPPGW